jgi:hypothetical protein
MPSHTLNSSRKLNVMGRTPKKQRKTPERKRPIDKGRNFVT